MTTALALSTVVVWLLALWSAWSVLRGPGILRRLKRAVLTGVLAVLALALSASMVLTRAFYAFSGETFIAVVTTRPLSKETFEITYTPASAQELVSAKLAGNQWAIAGGIIKWHSWLTALGLPTYHRPQRLVGQFADLARQQRSPSSVAPLAPQADWLWELLYRAQPYLPFVEAVYGSSAYAYVEPGVTFDVYVTSSGYLVKRSK